jgi:hypothetical protein
MPVMENDTGVWNQQLRLTVRCRDTAWDGLLDYYDPKIRDEEFLWDEIGTNREEYPEKWV